MPEDRSLDEFAGGPSGDGAEGDEYPEDDEHVPPVEDDTGSDTGGVVSDDDVAKTGNDDDDVSSVEDNETGPVATDDVDPATTTSAWASEGGRCERCGDTVRRLWEEDGAFVCPDCKEW